MPDWIVPLLTLTGLEVVLGLDNIVFLAILTARLPKDQQDSARRFGLLLALGSRLLLLFAISWILSLTVTAFELPTWLPGTDEARSFSWKDLILIVGGAFLIGKSTMEIHEKLEGHVHETTSGKGVVSYGSVLLQMTLLDVIFSIDSVITAVGLVEQLWVIVVAMILTVGVMLVFARPVSTFVEHHPTFKMLALSFLILIGVLLVAEGFGQHIEKGYVYFAMAFSLGVELLNLRVRAQGPPVVLHEPHLPPPASCSPPGKPVANLALDRGAQSCPQSHGRPGASVTHSSCRRQHLEVVADHRRQSLEKCPGHQGVSDRNLGQMWQRAEQHKVIKIKIMTGVHPKAESVCPRGSEGTALEGALGLGCTTLKGPGIGLGEEFDPVGAHGGGPIHGGGFGRHEKTDTNPGTSSRSDRAAQVLSRRCARPARLAGDLVRQDRHQRQLIGPQSVHEFEQIGAGIPFNIILYLPAIGGKQRRDLSHVVGRDVPGVEARMYGDARGSGPQADLYRGNDVRNVAPPRITQRGDLVDVDTEPHHRAERLPDPTRPDTPGAGPARTIADPDRSGKNNCPLLNA